jgi:hypothetical protein
MALNTQKLLPSAKSSSAIIKSTSVKATKFLAPNTSITDLSTTKSKTIFQNTEDIKTKAIEVDKLLKNTLLLKESDNNRSKREKESDKRKKREDILEKKPDPKDSKLALPKTPKIGLLDSIKRFLFFTFLGYGFTKFNKYLPQIVDFGKKLAPAADFIENFAGNIFNSLVTFIDWGYKASDATRGFLKDIGGDNATKLFDKFSNSLNDFINASIIFGMLATKGRKGNVGGFGGKGGRIGFDAGGRRVGLKAQQRYLSRFGDRSFTKRFGTKNLAKIEKSAAKQFGNRAARLAGRGLGKIPIIGGLINFVINLALGEPLGRAAAKAVGASVGSALGTFIPIPFAGTILGGILGDIVGGALYDTLVGQKNNPKAHAQGGTITRSGQRVGGNIGRTIKKSNKIPERTIPQQTIPGKDIGGIKEINKLYGSDKNPESKSPLRVLKKTSTSLKKLPLFGNLMGASIDIAMGQKPDRGIFRSIANSFGAFIQGVIDNNITSSVGDVLHAITGLAGGGTVPRTLMSDSNVGYSVGTVIGKVFGTMLDRRVNEIFQSIRKEMGLKGGYYGEGEGEGSIPLKDGETASGVALAQGLVQRGFTKEEASAIVGNLWAESGFRTNATNPDSGAFGLMQWLGGRKSRLYAYAYEKGKSVTDVDLQLDYIKWELKGGNAYETEQFKKAMSYGEDVAAKTRGFAEQVERAGSGELASSMSKRIGAAESVYKGKLVQGETPSIGLGKGYGGAGVKIAGELGRYMKKLGIVPGSIWEHPEHGGVLGRHAKGSLHYQGRAIDLGAWAWEQAPILKAIEQFNSMKGVKPVQVFHAGNDPFGHADHVHVAYKKGGRVSRPTKALVGERGPEFIFDTDTTKGLDRMMPYLLEKLNAAKTKDQLTEVLRSYADYEENEIVVMIQPIEKIITKTVPISSSDMNTPHSSVVNNLIPKELMIS